MYEFKLPDLGEGIREGEILEWHVEAGSVVGEDDPLVEVETDKAAVTIPSPKAGKVVQITGSVGDTVPVGRVIVTIDDGTGDVAQAPEKAPTEAAREAPARSEKVPAGIMGPVPAAPATRRMAREMGIDVNSVAGTGPGGRVTVEDVRRLAGADPEQEGPKTSPHVPAEDLGSDRAAIAEYAAHAASTIPFLDVEPMPDFAKWGPVRREKLRSIRRKVARKMVTSMILAPHVAHMDEADVTDLEAFRLKERERRKGEPGGRLTLLAFVVKAITAGLKKAPAFNASLDPFVQEIVYKDYFNIGVAVDTGHGLVVPVIKGTDTMSIVEISRSIGELATGAREGSLAVEDLRGGTFTITNVGPLGGTAIIPTINYPEVAILGMGQVQEKPVVRDGDIVARKILPLTLAFDHRVADGADAARFVSEMVRQLSDPNLLLLET